MHQCFWEDIQIVTTKWIIFVLCFLLSFAKSVLQCTENVDPGEHLRSFQCSVCSTPFSSESRFQVRIIGLLSSRCWPPLHACLLSRFIFSCDPSVCKMRNAFIPTCCKLCMKQPQKSPQKHVLSALKVPVEQLVFTSYFLMYYFPFSNYPTSAMSSTKKHAEGMPGSYARLIAVERGSRVRMPWRSTKKMFTPVRRTMFLLVGGSFSVLTVS